MATIGEKIQQADWKKEKHVPVIECADAVKAGEALVVKVTVGKEIAHPNTTEHHISWIDLFFTPEGDKFAYHVGRYEFCGHGESMAGANQGPIFTSPEVTTAVKINKPGVLLALSLCNIHGLWESSQEIKLA